MAMAMAVAGGSADSFDLDALALSDRFRLFNFTRRELLADLRDASAGKDCR
jgi:hypothetical protein